MRNMPRLPSPILFGLPSYRWHLWTARRKIGKRIEPLLVKAPVDPNQRMVTRRACSAGAGGRRRQSVSGSIWSISGGGPDIRALLVVLSAPRGGDVLLAAPVLVRDVYGVRDHGSHDSGDLHQEKPLPVNSWEMRAHVNWLVLSLLVQR
jgi:hypothetical protein